MAKHDEKQDVMDEVFEALNCWIENFADEHNFFFEANIVRGKDKVFIYYDETEVVISVELKK